MNKKLIMILLGLGAFILTGCASERKARQAEREKVSQATGLFCDFVNGEQFHDVDVQTNFVMAKRCDPAKPFSITNYKNSSDIFGVVYCCNINRGGTGNTATAGAPGNSTQPAPKKDTPAGETNPPITIE